MKNLYILIALLAIVFHANAGQVSQGGLHVTKVMAGYKDGSAFFFVDKAPLNPKGCGAPHSNYNILNIDPDRSDVAQVLSILLSAKALNAEIDVQIYDDYCNGDHAVIRRVGIN